MLTKNEHTIKNWNVLCWIEQGRDFEYRFDRQSTWNNSKEKNTSFLTAMVAHADKDVEFKLIKTDWKQKYIDAFNAGKLELKYKDKEDVWRKPNITPDNIELLLSYNEYEFRIIDEYTKFEDALKAGNIGVYRSPGSSYLGEHDLWTDFNGTLDELRSFRIENIRIKEIKDPYQKFIDAEKCTLKVVQWYNRDVKEWENKNKEDKYRQYVHYRIMQYVHFDKSDLKSLYKRDVIDTDNHVSILFIDICNRPDALKTMSRWYSYEQAFKGLRFYDPAFTTFEDMPIFGKLMPEGEVKE